MKSFSEYDPQFLKNGSFSWGIGLVGVSGRKDLTGKGVKIGIIDSGCDASHPLLGHIASGKDFTKGATADSWKSDLIGHGTHCAGVVGASSSEDGASLRGLCPEAELHIYKIFPDGTFFSLGEALEQAISDGMDIVNLSLGSRDVANFLVEKFQEARELGVVCIVAAGNSGDSVLFPANLSSVIAVSACGTAGVQPLDSISAATVNERYVEPGGVFLPRFTCFGDAIDFVGPGVGVISTVPNGGLQAMDGTSMAAPHVAGVAGLILAHDAAVRSVGKSAARVDMLFQRLRQFAGRLPFGGEMVGAGLARFGTLGQGADPVVSGTGLRVIETPWGYRAVPAN